MARNAWDETVPDDWKRRTLFLLGGSGILVKLIGDRLKPEEVASAVQIVLLAIAATVGLYLAAGLVNFVLAPGRMESAERAKHAKALRQAQASATKARKANSQLESALATERARPPAPTYHINVMSVGEAAELTHAISGPGTFTDQPALNVASPNGVLEHIRPTGLSGRRAEIQVHGIPSAEAFGVASVTVGPVPITVSHEVTGDDGTNAICRCGWTGPAAAFPAHAGQTETGGSPS